jgi:glycolate oxidase iron-sulfur subunit
MALFRLLVRLIGLYQALGLQWLARHSGILRLLGLKETEAFLPRIPRQFVVPKGEVYPAQSVRSSQRSALSKESGTPTDKRDPRTESRQLVSFFAGCVMSTALADVDRATIRVLQRAGCDVVSTAGQGCCGALNAHGGDVEHAREMMKRNIAVFEQAGQAEGTDADAQGTPIIVNSAGCGAMLKDYAHHLRDDPEWAARARAFTARVRDVTEFLATRDLPLHQPPASPNGTATSAGGAKAVVYQDACHLAHAQRISQAPRALLRAIPGVQLREMAENGLCCGSAGIYNVTNPAESRRLQQRKLDNALATGAQTIATANPGCLLQLQSGLRERGSAVQVKHVVELLDEATAP